MAAAECLGVEDRPERLLFTRNDAAYALSVSVRTIDNLIADKELPCVKIGRRVLIHRNVLHAYAKGRKVKVN